MFWTIVFTVASPLSLLLGGIIGWSMLEQYRRIKRTPLSLAEEVRDGEVSVCGEAQMFVPQETPFSRTETAYCEARAQTMEFTEDGKVKPNSMNTVYQTKTTFPFLIEDASGKILVSPVDGFIDIVNTFRHDNYKWIYRKVEVKMPPDPIRQTLDEVAVAYSNSNGPLPMEFTESSIEPGTLVYAVGTCSSKQDDINRALDGIDLEPDYDIQRVLLSPNAGDKLYLAPGDILSVSSGLLRFALTVISISTVIAVILGCLAVARWTT